MIVDVIVGNVLGLYAITYTHLGNGRPSKDCAGQDTYTDCADQDTFARLTLATAGSLEDSWKEECDETTDGAREIVGAVKSDVRLVICAWKL